MTETTKCVAKPCGREHTHRVTVHHVTVMYRKGSKGTIYRGVERKMIFLACDEHWKAVAGGMKIGDGVTCLYFGHEVQKQSDFNGPPPPRKDRMQVIRTGSFHSTAAAALAEFRQEA